MCTRAIYTTDDLVLVGRTMDFRMDLATNLWALPKGSERDTGEGGLAWTSAYGSVVATCFDLMSADGMNEAGLAGHLLWLTEADYGTPDPSRTGLPLSMWLQYYLDNFDTVAAAVRWMEEVKPRIIPMVNPLDGSQPTLHLALDDATGDSAIVEYTGGEAHIWHGREHQVMTNSPTYDEQLELVKQWSSGDDLPGSTEATARFARAQHYIQRLPQPETSVQAVAGVASVMRNVSQPFRLPDPDKPYASQTLWMTVSDLTHRRYIFESTTRPNVVWVNLDDLDLSEGAPTLKLDLLGDTALQGGLAGNVADKFADMGPLNIILPSGSGQ
jgi:penicillin V acylase-like amidase (Ntn superfamily)